VNRRIALLALSALLGVSACSFVQERESTARIAVRAATIAVIDNDEERAQRVTVIASRVWQAASDDPQPTVDALMALTRDEIRWDRLNPAEQDMVNLLLLEIRAQLIEKFPDNIIPEDARVTVRVIAEWVIETAQFYLPA